MIVTERIYRDKDGKPTTDPKKAVSLLYPEGTELTDEQAAALPDGVVIDTKAKKSASEDKSLKQPPATK